MVFSISTMAAGGVGITKRDTFGWRDATRCPTVRISRQEKMVFESSSESRKSWDGRKMTRQCIPNFWCDRRKRCRGCHEGFAERNTYWQGWWGAEWSHRRIAWDECSEVGGLLRLQDRVSDGSYLEIYLLNLFIIYLFLSGSICLRWIPKTSQK